jgi:uncharacterized protein YegL
LIILVTQHLKDKRTNPTMASFDASRALTTQLQNMHFSKKSMTETTTEKKMVAEKPKQSDVHCYIDCSGSMHGARIDSAKAALIDLFENLDDGDGMSLYKFSSSIDEVFSIKMKKYHKDYKSAVAGITAGGRTVLYDAIVSGMVEAKKAYESNRDNKRQHIQRLIVLTDGEDVGSTASLEVAIDAIRKPGFPTCKVFIVAVGSAIESAGVLRLQELPAVEVVPAADAAGIAEAFHKLKLRLQETTTVKTTTVTETRKINGHPSATKLLCVAGGGGSGGEGSGGSGGSGEGGEGGEGASRGSVGDTGGGKVVRGVGFTKPSCKYGADCTNSSADHRSAYHHSFKTKCNFGAGCNKHDDAHRKQFAHPKA